MRISNLLNITVIIVGLAMSGCTAIINKYSHGYIEAGGKDVNNQGIHVTLPDNAPSISQRFTPAPDGIFVETEAVNHDAIDILAHTGTPVIAPAAGKVIKAFRSAPYGHTLVIHHGMDTSGQDITTMYFHLKKRLVKVADAIVRGQQIGVLGMTGFLAPFPHLHYAVYKKVRITGFDRLKALNPHLFWADGVGKVTCYDKNRAWPNRVYVATYPVPCKGVPWK